jgi:hypothetical protein
MAWSWSFFGGAGAVLMRADYGAVDHRVFVVGVGGEMVEDLLPDPALGPAAEPTMGILPIAEALRQIAPWDAGAVTIEHRFDEAAIVLGSGADMADPPRQPVLDPLPLVIAQSISGHRSALSKPIFH